MEEDEDDASGETVDPLSALVLRNADLDVAKLPSVKPADSLALAPKGLASSETTLFLAITKPGVITLKNVVDTRGDRFRITPHKEAIVIECPTGGQFMDGTMVKAKSKLPTELRCVGDEEVTQFQARGVGALRVAWKKTEVGKQTGPIDNGVIEGIEDELESVDQLALVRRDKMSKTHTVPLRLVHDKPGVFSVSLTSVSDSMHNTYTPAADASAEKSYRVVARPSLRLVCPTTMQLLEGQTSNIPVEIEGSGPFEYPFQVSYGFRSPSGETSTTSYTMSRKSSAIHVDKPGVYTLLDVTGACGGTILEPSSCNVQVIPPPTMEMSQTTLHEW
jgi:nucleoporin POM152